MDLKHVSSFYVVGFLILNLYFIKIHLKVLVWKKRVKDLFKKFTIVSNRRHVARRPRAETTGWQEVDQQIISSRDLNWPSGTRAEQSFNENNIFVRRLIESFHLFYFRILNYYSSLVRYSNYLLKIEWKVVLNNNMLSEFGYSRNSGGSVLKLKVDFFHMISVTNELFRSLKWWITLGSYYHSSSKE